MHIIVIVVTRNVSVSVKSLHTLMGLNKICAHFKHTLDTHFVKDDIEARNAILLKSLKKCDRLIWIDYGIYVDENSLVALTDKFPNGFGCLVCPCVTDTISWDSFKKKILDGSEEPISQMALEFDTTVSKVIGGTKLHTVASTVPKCWSVDSKTVLKSLKDKKGEGITLPYNTEDLFKKIMDRGVRVCAFTDAKLVATYAHECLGNILESAGIQAN